MADTITYRIFEVVSDDDANTWNFWGFLFEAARHPHIAVASDGHLLRAARCDDACIRAILQPPKGGPVSPIFPFKDAFGVPLVVEDDSFCVQQEPGDPARWLLVCKLVGGIAISLFHSYDECATWAFQGTMFPGGGSPVIAVSPYSTLYAARVGNTLQGRIQYPGDPGPQGAFTFSAGATLVTVATGSGFGIAAAKEDPRRWLLSCVLEEPAGTFVVTDWSSGDEAKTWQRLT